MNQPNNKITPLITWKTLALALVVPSLIGVAIAVFIDLNISGRISEETLVNPWITFGVDFVASTKGFWFWLVAVFLFLTIAVDFSKFPVTHSAFRVLYQIAISFLAGKILMFGALFIGYEKASQTVQYLPKFENAYWYAAMCFILGIVVMIGGQLIVEGVLKLKVKLLGP